MAKRKMPAQKARRGQPKQKGSQTKLQGKVVQVDDGDTILVQVLQQQGPIPYNDYERVRLRRLNAPEMNEQGGKEAKQLLEQRLHGRYVEVVSYARKQSRLIGEVKVLPSRVKELSTNRQKRVREQGGRGEEDPWSAFLRILVGQRSPDRVREPSPPRGSRTKKRR